MKSCNIKGCDNKGVRRGLCNKHYRASSYIRFKICKVEGCSYQHHAKGLCVVHYGKKRDHKGVYRKRKLAGYKPPYKKSKWKGGICSVDYCDRRIYRPGLCWGHWNEKFKGVLKVDADLDRIERKLNVHSKRLKSLSFKVYIKNEKRKKGLLRLKKFLFKIYKKREKARKKFLYDSRITSCTVENCKNNYHAKGYCQSHYNKFINKYTVAYKKAKNKKNKGFYIIFSKAINKSLKKRGINKNGRKWEAVVGYTLSDLINHLEGKFKEGMTWENRGVFGWHIDHIRPQSSFDFSSIDDIEFKECWSLDNLQPLWYHENIKKSNKIAC